MQSRQSPPSSESDNPATAENDLSRVATNSDDSALLTSTPISVLIATIVRRIVARVREASLVRAVSRRWTAKPQRNDGGSAEAKRAGGSPQPAPAVGTLQARLAAFSSRTAETFAQTSPRKRRVLAGAGLFAVLPAAYVAFCVLTIPFASGGSNTAAPSAIVFEGADGKPFATRGILKGQPLTADTIPPVLASAVTAIEDRRFYQHGGVDLRAMGRAAWHDITGRRLEGGSTITQQLARRLYLSPDRTLKRKVQEAALAFWLELRYPKKEILARYLNTVYFGAGAYGANSAALRYFGKSAQQLTLSEAALLAGVIKAPSELEPDRNPTQAQQRAGIVLDAMVDTGAISRQQADQARAQPVALHVAADSPPGDNYFLDSAAADAKAQAGATTQDLTVRTTLDPELQKIAENVVARRLAAMGKPRNASQAALIAMTPDGAILAMVGGRDYNESQFNRVTQAHRQPGSLFKAIVYLAAMRKGYTPDATLIDQPISVGDWEPDNYGDRFYGPVTLRTAFAHSLNSIAVQLGQSVGISTVINTAKRLGIRSDLPPVPSVVLGSAAVTPLEMTKAMAAIATNTANIEPYTVRTVGKNDQTVYTRPTPPPAAAADSPTVHAEMLDLLTDVVRQGTGTAARLNQPSGGKTGTSEDYRDAWFVGFTSDLVVGVWVGNDDNSPMNNVTGGSIPASIWHDFVSAAESMRHPSAVADAGTPTINFASMNAEPPSPEQSYRYNRGSGFRMPFRLFGFRF